MAVVQEEPPALARAEDPVEVRWNAWLTRSKPLLAIACVLILAGLYLISRAMSEGIYAYLGQGAVKPRERLGGVLLLIAGLTLATDPGVPLRDAWAAIRASWAFERLHLLALG